MAVAISRTATGGVGSSGGVVNTGSISIGTESVDRIIVLACTSETASASQTSATIDFGNGDTAMTALAQSNLGGSAVYARLFYLPVPTGTTATFKITYNAAVTSGQNQHSVYAVTGAALTLVGSGVPSSTDMDATSPITTGSITFTGGFIGVAACATGSTGAKTWANATEDQEVNPGAYTHATATRTASLSATAITLTGGTNNEDGSMAWMSFKPGYFSIPDAGSYALTGTAATLTLGHRTGVVDSGSYAITGTAATPTPGHRIIVDAGSYALTGTAATFLKTWRPIADAGSYALSGTIAATLHGFKIAADVGSYTITGTSAAPLNGFRITADAGSYALTGTSATFSKTWRVATDAGSYDLTGANSSALHGWAVAADVGSYAITGSDATPTKTSALSIAGDAGSYALTGTTASTLHGFSVIADVGSYTLTGTVASLLYGRRVAAGAGSYTLVGSDATPTKTVPGVFSIAADPGSYSLTGTSAATLRGLKIVADAASYALVGDDATFVLQRILNAIAGSYILVGTAATPTISLPFGEPDYNPRRMIAVSAEVRSVTPAREQMNVQ